MSKQNRLKELFTGKNNQKKDDHKWKIKTKLLTIGSGDTEQSI